MLKLATNTKLAFARALFQFVSGVRKVFGLSSESVLCKRDGLLWNLNLSEGIDLAIYLFGIYERATARVIRTQLFPGAIVLDIGANIGAIGMPMAKQVGPKGRVYEIEATQWAFQKLTHNKSLNPELNESLVPIHAVLVASEAGDKPSEIHSSWNLFASTVHPIHGGTLNSTEGAQTLPLDSLVDRLKIARVDFVKMDVDGFEVKVLRGAKKTFQRFKPNMILELSSYALEEQGNTLEELIELLKEFGYELPGDLAFLKSSIPKNGSINLLVGKETKII